MSEFTISFSAAERFAQCPRAHFHKCFTSDGGWFSNKPERTKLAYALKKMDGYYGWLGNMVHDTIQTYLTEKMDGKKPSIDTLTKRGISRMGVQWEQSLGFTEYNVARLSSEFGFLPLPPMKNTTVLIEHHSQDPRFKKPEKLKEAQQKYEFLMQSFKASPVLKKILKHPGFTTKTGQFEILDSLTHDGVKVWIKADVILMDAHENTFMPDWKTGRASLAHEVQLGVYALYLAEKFGVNPNKLEVCDVYLSEREASKQVVSYQISEHHVQMAKNYLSLAIKSVGKNMKSIAMNTPKPEKDWPKMGQTVDDGVCRFCQYKQICYGKAAIQ